MDDLSHLFWLDMVVDNSLLLAMNHSIVSSRRFAAIARHISSGVGLTGLPSGELKYGDHVTPGKDSLGYRFLRQTASFPSTLRDRKA